MFYIEKVIYGLIICVVTYIVYSTIKWNRILNIVFKMPGPKRIPVLHSVLDFVSLDVAGMFTICREFAKKYGPVYSFSVLTYPSVTICGPEEFETVSSSMKHIQKGPLYNFLHAWLGQGLLTSTGSHWQQRRKILTPAFHFSILQKFIEIFNEETAKLVERLKIETEKPSTNVLPLMSQSTLYIIAETSFGIKMDENNQEDKKYVSAIHKVGDILTYRVVRPWIFNNILFNLFPIGKKHRDAVKTLHKFTDRIIEEKSKTFKNFEITEDEYLLKKKLAFLDLLLKAKISDGVIDDKGIRDEVNTFMFEGHDTTSMALSFTLLLLAIHEEYQNILYEEIIAVLGDLNKKPDLNDLNELKIMERVIKESLRLYPSVPFIARTLESDITLNGYLVPSEVPLNIWIYDIHRNPKYWPEPEKFDPDRFLPENCVGRHPYAYVPFSAGPRNCIGQKFAILEIKAVLCGIIKNYILEPVDTLDSIKLVVDLVLRTQEKSIKIKFKHR